MTKFRRAPRCIPTRGDNSQRDSTRFTVRSLLGPRADLENLPEALQCPLAAGTYLIATTFRFRSFPLVAHGQRSVTKAVKTMFR